MNDFTTVSSFRLLMANQTVHGIVTRACAGVPNAAEKLVVNKRDDVGAFREGYTISLDGKAIVYVEVWQGAFGEVRDLLAADEKADEIRLTKKLIGLGQGINRFPGMWEGKLA